MNIPFKIAFNTSAQLLGKAATTISTIIVTVLITKNFSVGDYGAYVAILSYITLFYVFTDFGLNAIFVREVGNDEEKQKEFFKNLLGFRLVISIFVAFCAVGVLAFTAHPTLIKLGIIVALGLIIAQSFTATALALFQAKIRYDLALIADIFWAVANLVFVYIAATGFGSILFVIIALVAGGSVRVLVALYLARFQLAALSVSFDTKVWREMFFAALPIGLIIVFSQFNAQIDKQIVLLANYKPGLGLSGETAIGFYGLAYKIFELAIVLPAFVMNVGYPIMVQKSSLGVRYLIDFSKRLGFSLLGLGILGVIIGWSLTPFMIDVLGQGKFPEGVLTTRILLLGFPVFFVTPLTLWLAIILKKTREMLFIYGFAAAFNLVANLVAVPQFGYNAAAIVTIISEILIFTLSGAVLYIHLRFGKE
ncbi:MAG: oligosaccharide flippase family protein [Candidatus Woykebacteria bacterium]